MWFRPIRPILLALLAASFCCGFFNFGKKEKDIDKTPKKTEQVRVQEQAVDVDPDLNGDGVVDAEEKRKALERWSKQEEAERVKAEKEEDKKSKADLNGDGVVNAEEKRAAMQQWQKEEGSGDTPVKTSTKKGAKS